jgi:hypothetical protein
MPTWRASSRSGAICLTGSYGPELVTNGDNEAALMSFDEDSLEACAAAQSNTQAIGTNSCKITLDFTNYYGIAIYKDTDASLLTVGTVYRTSVWYYLPSSGQILDEFRLSVYNGITNYKWITSSTKDSWTNLIIDNAYNDQFLIRMYAIDNGLAHNSNVYYMDDLSVKAITIGLG